MHSPDILATNGMERYSSFITVYSTPERRLAKARQVFQPERFGTEPHPSRPTLAMHWADSDSELMQLASLLYQTKEVIDRRVGQRVMGFMKGRTADVKAPEGLRLVTGLIDDNELAYDLRPSPRGLESADCKVAIPLMGRQAIQVKRSGKIEVTPASADVGYLIFYASQLSLAGDPELYAATKRVSTPELVVGNDAVERVLADLSAGSGSAPLELAF